MKCSKYSYDLEDYDWVFETFCDLWNRVYGAPDPQSEFDVLPLRDQWRWSLKYFLSETANGGLDQYFWNTSGDESHILAAMLSELKLEVTLNTLNKCTKLFPDSTPAGDTHVRRRQMEDIRTKHGRIDRVVSYEVDSDICTRFRAYYEKAENKTLQHNP